MSSQDPERQHQERLAGTHIPPTPQGSVAAPRVWPDLDAIERLTEAATPGPWQVVETKHPHHFGGHHVERRVFTTWDHPQLKGPLGVVNSSVGIGEEKGGPARHMVGLNAADARLIAALDPQTVQDLIRLARTGLGALAPLGNSEVTGSGQGPREATPDVARNLREEP